ncbi:MAG TPA: glycosyltransferase family 1 protein [Gemmatimonadales bacterium]|nr:glycosyltransferase family 1 protein [Gemmatimonadales bacterium]
MRIALFSEVYWPMVSGVGVTLERTINALRARGHELRVYTATYPLPAGAMERDYIHRSPSVPFFLYPDVQWAFPNQKDVVDDLAAFRPDVVHVATEFAMGLVGMKAARQLNIPVIASAHTDYGKYAGRYGVRWALGMGFMYARWFYGQAEKVLVSSGMFQETLRQQGIHHTGLWTRGVDPLHFHPRFRSDAYRAQFGVGPDDLLVTYIGRLAREKDIMRLVQGWEALRPVRGSAQLVLVGQGPLEQRLRHKPVPGVHLTGLRSGEALSEAYASADLFIFPSATETFGNSLLEAMASGVPSLAVRAGGVLEFATEENALLVQPQDTPALTEGLKRLLLEPGLRARLSVGGLETAKARDWSTINDQLLADYALAASRRKHRAA